VLAVKVSDVCVETEDGIVPPPVAVITVAVVLAESTTRTSAEAPVPATKFAAESPIELAVGLIDGFEPVDALKPVVDLLLVSVIASVSVGTVGLPEASLTETKTKRPEPP
jgi:hypothetical protein